MPKGTKVSRCVDKVKKSRDEAAAIAICQASTNQGYATGRKLKESIASKVLKPGPGKPAKKLKDNKDDSWEKEEKREGYITPRSDDKGGYDSPTDDNASDDFKNGRWTNEDPPKKYKKKLKESLYKQIGSVLAEKLGFSQTQMDAQKNALKPLNPKPKRAKKPSLTAGGNKTTGANAAGDEGVPVGNDANKKSQELQQQGDMDHAMYEKEDTIMNKEKNKEQLDEILGTIVKGITRAAKRIKDTVAPKEDDPTMKRPGRRLRDAERSLETQSTQYNNAYVRKLMEMEGEAPKKPKKDTEPKGESSPNARPMTKDEHNAMLRLAAAGRGGPHDETPTRTRPGARKVIPLEKPTGESTIYHRIGRLFVEAKPQKESDRFNPDAGEKPGEARQAETGSGSNFRRGEGPKDPRKMTPAEKEATDTATAALIAKRAASRKP